MFNRLRARITRAYVLLALVLVLAVAAASTALAFLLYARGLSDAIPGAAQRVAEAAASVKKPVASLEAPAVLSAIGRSRFHVTVLDDRGRPVAQNEREGPPSPGRAVLIALGHAIGLPRATVTIPGGRVLINADFDRFGSMLVWYWSIMLPIGVLAVITAWLIARRITSRAVGPLIEVTQALDRIAQGDFSPRRLLNENSDLPELTGAYNDVAYRLATASAERVQTEGQMRQFIADAGHELRTPLTVIMGYLDVLRRGILQDAQATQHAYETMLDESRKMRELINKLIYLARLDRAPAPLRPVPTDVAAITDRVIAALAPLAHGRIEQTARDEGAIVDADESELSEAVKNVIENALKYAPDSKVRVGVERADGRVCVNVADSGPGMEAHDIEHAFDRFYRGSGRADVEGSGLGLAIAKRTVERAGGTIAIESRPGEGTMVTMCLPSLGKPPPAA
ncbi:MAG TPA: HAMP domain-containing sensor histidine kinase [Candidatus Baltobacteraceae bacterium]|nr:HAMP domain-containing sensor histidine kinase [Candidatus Baltobacteraceae bacterium]